MLALIFPFKWIHPCIACINKKNRDFLDAPLPYIMGILSSCVDLNELKTQYPNHIICNIDTSQIFSKPFNLLPYNEEEKMRRKIQFVRNPHIYFIEELNSICYDNYRPKDTSKSRSMAKNIQYIFFRVLRCPLENYKFKYIINEKVFDPEKFLNEFDCEDYKFFWNKIIQTLGFEYFIFSDQYIDDSNNIIFENICKLSEDDTYIDEKNAYTYTLNIQNYMRNIVKDVERDRKYDSEYKQNINKVIEDHSFINKSRQAINNEKCEKEKASKMRNKCESISPLYRLSMFATENSDKKTFNLKREIEKEPFYLEEEKLSLKSNYKINERDLSQNENSNSSIKIETSGDIGWMLNEEEKIKNAENYFCTKESTKESIKPLAFYGKKGVLSYVSYIKSRIKCMGYLTETYFLKEVTSFLDKEIKENPHLSALEKFEFGNFNPLIISRQRGESFNNVHLKFKNMNEFEEPVEDNKSINLDMNRKNISGMNISAFLLNGEKGGELDNNNFIDLRRCDQPQYYLLLISYFNILRYTKSDFARKSVIDLNCSGQINTTSVKKLNAVRQYVLELYCKVSKFPKCEYSYLHFYNIINNLDIEITMKYLGIIPEKVK